MSLPDTVFIFALALIIFGPKKLPEIGRQIGRLVGEFRRASNEFKFQIEEELRQVDILEKRGTQPESSKPATDSLPVEETAASLPPPEAADPAEILPVGQYPNIATVEPSEFDAAATSSFEMNGSKPQAEEPEASDEKSSDTRLSAAPQTTIEISAAPGSQPRTRPPFAASAPDGDVFDGEGASCPESDVPADRPPARAEAEVTHG